MKNIIKSLNLFLITLLIYSCSSNDVNETPIIPIPEQATVDSFSENYGYSGENIVINGTNFTNDINKVKIFFDDITAEINSVTDEKINIKLPNTEKSVPILKIEIENRIITNNVINDYDGNIGILANSKNEWHTIDSNIGDGRIWKMQAVGKDKLYFSLNDNGGGGSVYRTIDGGINWKSWCSVGFDGSFYATNNDEGWSQTTFGVNKVPIGGSYSHNSDVHPSTSTIGLYVNDDLTKGFLISYHKIVYQTTDGLNFNEVYNNDPRNNNPNAGNFSQVRFFSELDENHIWAAGYTEVDQNLGYTPINKFYAPLILFLDNGNWTERSISGLSTSSKAKQIQFINKDKGYLYVRNNGSNSSLFSQIFKSIDGGNSWELLYDSGSLDIRAFTFKNETFGWFCSGNKIYKTIDGGINWTVDYTHNSDIINISYSDGIVWAITKDKILKYFTE